jgi:hypothetical protein
VPPLKEIQQLHLVTGKNAVYCDKFLFEISTNSPCFSGFDLGDARYSCRHCLSLSLPHRLCKTGLTDVYTARVNLEKFDYLNSLDF